MKKYILIVIVLLTAQLSFSQTTFKYVIIPTYFPEIGRGLNPYGVSSEIQKILSSKSIQCAFNENKKPDDYCDILTINLTKESNMFKNKLRVDLKDCMNNIVWTGEGEGRSKDFVKGYAEALADALSNLNSLPVNSIEQRFRETPAARAEKENPAIVAKDNEPASEKRMQPEKLPATPKQSDTNGYKPRNLYWNTTYFVDVITDPTGKEVKIIILNSKSLKYEDFQEIATLNPSGIENTYRIKWVTPEGKTLDGIASLSEQQLNISLNSDKDPIIISLQKY